MSQATTEPQKTTSRKVKALLAGGLVLGVGAAVTLAAWTDQEWAEGIFSTGSFNIESSVSGEEGSFNDHTPEEDGVAALTFELAGADNMAPDDTVSAPFVLRLDESTTYNAEVNLDSASVDGPNGQNLTYGITEVASVEECTANASGTTVVPTGTAMTSAEGANLVELTAGAEEAAGAPSVLCFEVSAGEELVEGASTTAQWQFIGRSTDE
ncbi:hypothetical protein GCM10009720_04950 [Yaniella flava]|uniref:SipW-cognate class signal peptide n=1 Tax=Yaniella flava TaxID=287930 RepID=A0ABN2U544_9MICC